MCRRNLGWSSGRSVGRFPAKRALKGARSIARWADLRRERFLSSEPGRLVAVISLIAMSSNPALAQDLGMPISPIWGVPEVGLCRTMHTAALCDAGVT
jgi:hypothetical protein